jgi:hypothetical protein
LITWPLRCQGRAQSESKKLVGPSNISLSGPAKQATSPFPFPKKPVSVLPGVSVNIAHAGTKDGAVQRLDKSPVGGG